MAAAGAGGGGGAVGSEGVVVMVVQPGERNAYDQQVRASAHAHGADCLDVRACAHDDGVNCGGRQIAVPA